ncbi:MAG: hypothetical protein NWP79_12000, partial [Paracoccaceae bacterium]|nr:hypothetical protein [Paracoccaceae bacterium]
MPTAKQDINDFRDRVKRIGNPRNTSYYDRDLGMEIPKRVSHKEIKKKNKKPSVLSTLLVSVILGGLGLMFAQVVRIRYFGLTEPSNLVLYLELFIA